MQRTFGYDIQEGGRIDEQKYGPRGLIVCGHKVLEQKKLLKALEKKGILELPIHFAAEDDLRKTLSKLLSLDPDLNIGVDSTIERAIILSGVTGSELHSIMDGHRKMAMPRTLWATLTPNNELWPLSDLLTELLSEREAFKKMRESQS